MKLIELFTRRMVLTTLFILIALYLVIVTAYHISAKESVQPQTDIFVVIEKIASTYIQQVIDGAENFSEAAETVGVEPEELENLCIALNITYDFPGLQAPVQPEPEIEPVRLSNIDMLKDSAYETDAILNYSGSARYVLLVDKSAHILYVLDYNDGTRKLVDSFDCKTGKNPGDKQVEGDQRTPEGVYFFIDNYDRKKIQQLVGRQQAYQYGEMAFVTNFPNVMDRLQGKNGSGIWLHGTDKEFDPTSPFDTLGCVVLSNDGIQKISSYIDLFETSIVIVDSLTVDKKEQLTSAKQEVLTMLEAWRESWEKKRIDDYINFYSPDFRSDGKNRSQWKNQKSYLSTVNGKVSIALDDFTVMRHNDGLHVQFKQIYSAGNLQKDSIGIKTLYLVPGTDSWKIISEGFSRL